MERIITAGLTLVLFGNAAPAVPADDAPTEPVSFSTSIAPLLLENCQGCHGAKKAEGSYRVDSFEHSMGEGDSGGIGFVAGSLDDSEAFRRILSDDVEERMPLERDPLSEQQIELLRRWINEGAKFDRDDPQASLFDVVSRSDQPAPPDSYKHGIPVAALQFNHDGTQLYAGGYHEITVWNTSDGALARRIRNIGQRTSGLDLSPDGALLVVGDGSPGRSGSVRLIDTATGQLRQVLGTAGDLVLDVCFSPDGSSVAATTVESGLKIYNVADGQERLAIASHSDWVTCVAWSPDGSKLVTGSRDKTCKLFDVESGELKHTYAGHGKAVRGVAFHPNGEEVYSSGSDNKIHRWKTADGAKSAEIAFGKEVFQLAVADPFLFAVSADGTVRKFDVKENKEVQKLAGHSDWPLSVDFHKATDRIASGGYDGEVRIWAPDQADAVVTFSAAP